MFVNQSQHEDQHHRNKNAVEHLRPNNDLDQRKVRDQHYSGAERQKQRIEPVKKTGVLEALIQSAFKNKALADRTRCGKRKDGRREDRRIEEASGKENKGVLPRERLHGLGSIRSLPD